MINLPENLPRSDRAAVFVALGFGSGLIPKAPGTWGSLVGLVLALPFYYIFDQTDSGLIGRVAFVTLMTGLAWWSIHVFEKQTGIHDYKGVVSDEFAGMAITLAFVPLTPVGAVCAFVLFRVFDIVKKGPVGWLDRNMDGPFGTLVDDLVAGLLAGLTSLIFFWN